MIISADRARADVFSASRAMRCETVLLAIALAAGTTGPAVAFAPDGCDQQRAQYPAKWNDTAGEKPLFTCISRGGAFRINIGAADSAGRTMMSLVPLVRPELTERPDGVLRIWLDKEQTQRLRDGKYLATVVRKENSCWIRDSLDGDTVFFMDNADPAADDEKKAGPFYNKAPRFSIYGDYSYTCEPTK
jgi:hypothetical protein